MTRWLAALLLVAAAAGAAASCEDGGQVCKQPNAADCPSHSGGEATP